MILQRQIKLFSLFFTPYPLRQRADGSISMMEQNGLGAQSKDSKGEKKRRAGLPKVRTGCITCKLRRVKCDENRPACNRCTKFGVKCDGFLVLPPPRYTSQPRNISNRPLVPYGQNATDVLMVLQEPSASRFQSQEEHRFFQLYVTKTATHLSGYYGPTLWNQIVLQASEAEESIRHAVISIGALDMITVSGRSGTKTKGSKETDDHHVFALSQYSKAIHSLRQKVVGTNYDLRTALVASLLIVAFETYHGNYKSANQQTKAVVQLINSQLTSPSASTRKVEDEVGVELLRALDRLDINSMSQTDPYSLSEHLSLLDCNADLLVNIPERFEDVTAARHYFNLIVRQVVHFACAFWAAHASPYPSQSTTSSPAPRKPSLSYFDAVVPCKAEFLVLGAAKFEQVKRWMSSFRPLFEEKRAKRGSKECLAVSALRSQYLVIYVGTNTIGTMNEMCYDAYLPWFRELVDLCEDLVVSATESRREGGANGEGEMFVFDMQSTMPLDFVGKKCRDPEVRRKAIWLLRMLPKREAFWDSVLAASVCEWVMRVEEEGMVEGIVPDEWRARGVGVALGAGLEDGVKSVGVWCTLGSGERIEGVVEW